MSPFVLNPFDECTIYSAVVNITNHCEVDLLGYEIKTPCIPLCISALTYAANYCSTIFGQSNLLEKIINLLKTCENPLVKEAYFQNNN